MNKKFWMLIVTGAVLAAGVTASGCAAQRRFNPTIVPTAAAIETTSETEAEPEETKMPAAEEKTFTNENTPETAKTLENNDETTATPDMPVFSSLGMLSLSMPPMATIGSLEVNAILLMPTMPNASVLSFVEVENTAPHPR